jgi:hypothetical protein
MRISFVSPVPLNSGCKVSYWFPTDFYNTDHIKSLRTGSLFSVSPVTYTQQTLTIKEEDDGYKSVNFDTCPTFRSQSFPETSQISGLIHPKTVQESTSLKIFIRDSNSQLIAYADQRITF